MMWRTTIAGLTVAGALLAGTLPASAQEGEGEPRVRELKYRVRDLTYRTGAQDASERVSESAEETTVILSADVLFEFNKSDLNSDAVARLEDLAAELEELGGRKITIGGHTDGVGDAAYNQTLSEERAEAVRKALDDQLGDDFEFEVAGYGADQPVAPNTNEDGSDNPTGRAANRRVEIQYPN